MNDRPETDLELSNARLHVLAEASRAFALVATEYPLLLPRIARTTADLVGDGCIVTLIGGDGESLINVANAHRDPGLETDYRAYLAGMGVSKTSSGTVSGVVAQTGEPRWEPDVDPVSLVAKTDAALKPLVTRLNVHSYAVVPIRARHAVAGAQRSGAGLLPRRRDSAPGPRRPGRHGDRDRPPLRRPRAARA